jgi:predicted amidophosphoribosyltransferase
MIAEALAESLSIPVDTISVTREQSHSSVKDLSSYEERQDMVREGLRIKPNAFMDKTVLLIDDLYQTGATAETIARACKSEGGANRVLFLVITKTRG